MFGLKSKKQREIENLQALAQSLGVELPKEEKPVKSDPGAFNDTTTMTILTEISEMRIQIDDLTQRTDNLSQKLQQISKKDNNISDLPQIMLEESAHCMKCKKQTKMLNPQKISTNNVIMLAGSCAECGSRTAKRIKNE